MKAKAQKTCQALLIISIAGLMMGNKSCEEQPVAQPRKLKKIVEMGRIASSPINLPSGGAFDFEFVANQQVYGVLAENEAFTLRYTPPIVSAPSQSSGDSFLSLSKYDKTAFKSFAKNAGRDDFQVQFSKQAWCMVNLPQTRISGSVNSFEMIGGGGLTIGFNSNGQHNSNGVPELGFNVEFAQLDVSMIAMRPLTNKVMAASNVTSKQTKTQVSFGINLGAFRLGPKAYYQTPLATVTKKALTTAVSNLDAQLESEEWFTRVLADHDTHIVVIGGKDVKLLEGDELLIYNEDYYWDGEPCNSTYRGGGASADAAVAKIKIDWVGDEISRGRVIEQADEAVMIGSKVKLFKFAEPTATGSAGAVQGRAGSNP